MPRHCHKALRAAARVDGGAKRTQRRPTVHVVRRGESIWTIARRNNMDPKTLMRLNNMRPGDTLPAGKRLVVSAKDTPAPRTAATTATASGPSKAAAARTVQHTVRSGDTLYRIAKLYQVTVAQIASWNGITASMTLRPGQKLNINLGRRRWDS